MRNLISLAALVISSSACANAADNCHNTHTCPPPLDAGVIYVVSDARCDGVCVPTFVDVAGWSTQPFILWRGSTMSLPDTECPPNAPKPGQVWYASPDQTPAPCPACSCAPSMGGCMLPDTVTISTSPVCPGDAGVPFDPPSDWDGGCTSNDAVAAPVCDGGSCLATVGSMVPVESGCVPDQVVVPKLVTWGFAAYGCAGRTNGGTCEDPGDICAPAPPSAASGFSICVSRQGDDALIQCPRGYPARNVFYPAGDDDRACAPCECGPPEGGSCSSLVSVYADGACSVPVGTVAASSSGPVCVSIPADSSLGSKQASPPVYTPGTCQPSGGEQTGSVKPIDPITFCCQQ